MKIAKIIPIYKSKEKNNMGMYSFDPYIYLNVES